MDRLRPGTCAILFVHLSPAEAVVLTLTAPQLDQLAKHAFYARLSRFLAARGLSDGFRRAALDTAATYSLWDEHWQAVRTFCEHDAALHLAFVLAWSLDGGNVDLALKHLQQKADPEMLMKRVLSERGHLRFSELDRPANAGASA